MLDFQANTASRQRAVGRFSGSASISAGHLRIATTDRQGRPSAGLALGMRRSKWVPIALALSVSAAAPGVSHGSTHADDRLCKDWPRATETLLQPGTSIELIVRAARDDVAARPADGRDAQLEFARFLLVEISDPEIRLQAKRAADILVRFMSRPPPDTRTFWAEFSLATFQQLAGDHRAVAMTLSRALERARAEGIPAHIVSRTRGIMGHAQQVSGMLREARDTFEALQDDPFERAHANVHLGEIALDTHSVGAGLDIWMSHPDGVVAGVAVIIDEADALWRSQPERSYRLVAEAVMRLEGGPPLVSDSEHEAIVARLIARTRENAMSGGMERESSRAGGRPSD